MFDHKMYVIKAILFVLYLLVQF